MQHIDKSKKLPSETKLASVVTMTEELTVSSILVTCMFASVFFSAAAVAAPQGGAIVAGQGSINQVSNTTNIHQQTNTMVVDWSSFNVAARETVNFNQPSASAAALNRIYDQSPSQIFGAINANGRVFLSNPNGMVFGQNATINVGALIATGLSISNEDFMSGNLHFNADNYTPGAIINHGLISAAAGGSVSLIGGQVTNTGYIVADYGQINLTTGKQAVLNFDGDGLINISVSEDVIANMQDADSSVANSGSLQANGGTILLEANAAKDVFTNAINNEGVITAQRLENVGGEVYLAGNAGTTIHSGDIDATGEDGQGGTVFLLGENVGVFDDARIDASGSHGGGIILLGGDYQGNNSDVQNATATYVAEDASISADAIDSGDGGKVIVWADDTTRTYGDISATGGAGSGNGGLVETSGRQYLEVTKTPDITAVNGDGGLWLIDPFDITIVPGNTPTGINSVDPFVSVADSSTLGVDLIKTALTGGASVSITTGSGATLELGDITLDTELDYNGKGNATLNLTAGNDININALIRDSSASGTDSLTLVFDAGNDININANIVTEDASVDLTAVNDIKIAAEVDSGAATITVTATSLTSDIYSIDSTDILDGGFVVVDSAGTIGKTAPLYTDITAANPDALTLTSCANCDIRVVDISQFDFTDLSITPALTGTRTIDITAADWDIDEPLNVGTNKLVLRTATQINDVGDNTITASELSLLSDGTGDFGADAASTILVSTDVLNVKTGGDLRISNALDMSNLNLELTSTNKDIIIAADTQTFSFTKSSSDLTVNTVTAPDLAFTLNYTPNEITAGNINVSAGTVNLSATGIQGGADNDVADITAATIDLTTTSGDIGDSTVLDVTATTALNADTSSGGNIEIDSIGNLPVGIIDAGSGTITLDASSASGGSITLGRVTTTNTTTSSIVLRALTDILDANTTGSDISSGGRLEIVSETGVGAADFIETAVDSIKITNATSGDIKIDNTGNLIVERAIQTLVGDIYLTSSGTITDTGASGIIDTSLLSTSSAGDTTLDETTYLIDSYNGTTTTGGTITLIDSAGGLVITGISSAADAVITTTGDLSQSGSIISATTLTTVSTSGSTDLTSNNTITNYDGTTTGISKDLAITDVGGLNINAISATGNADIITTGDLSQSGIINAVTLTTVSTGGATDLSTSTNTVTNYNGTTTGTAKDLAFTDAAGLNITGITATGDADITTSGDLTQSGGVISAVALTTRSTGGSTDLTANNTIASYNGTTTGANKNLSIVDSTGDLNVTDTGAGYGISSTGSVDVTSSNKLTISNAITSGTDILLTADKMAINSTVNANTGLNDVSLQSGTNAINLSATAGDLVDSTLELTLTELNNISAAALTIGNGTSGNIIVSQLLTLNPLNISALHLVTGATVTDTGVGGFNGDFNLAIETDGVVTLDGADNNVATLAIDAGTNNVTFIDNNLLTTGDVDGIFGIQGNDIVLTATAGNLVVGNSSATNDIDAGGTLDLSVLTAEQNLHIVSGSKVSGTSGTHTYTADNMQIDGTVDASGQTVLLQSVSTGNLIDLGVAIGGAAVTLELTSAELANITADKLTIGNTSAGTINISNAITPSHVTELELITSNAITDGNLADPDITVNTLTASAVNGIGNGNPVETAVSVLDATNTTAGEIRIANTGSLDITKAVQNTTGNIVISASGTDSDINVNGAISTLNNSSIILSADDSIILADVGDLTATGNGLILLQANVSTSNGNGGDQIAMDSDTVIDAGSGQVFLNTSGANGGNITVGQIKTTSTSTASISLISEAGIIDADATTTNDITSAGRLVISSKTGVGTVNALDTAVASINVYNEASGDINIINAGTLAVQQAIQNNTDDINLTASGENADINVNGAITAVVGGNVLLTADDSITMIPGGNIVAGGTGDITLTANNATTNGDSGDLISMADGVIIDAGSGVVSLSTAGANGGSITIGQIKTISISNTSVTLNSETNVIDADAGIANDVISGGGLIITSKTGVGAANALDTAVASIDITNATNGKIDINNTGNLNIVNAVQTTTGDITLTSTGTLTDAAGGTITADLLTTSSIGNTTLDSANNSIASYTGTALPIGDITVVDNSGDLIVTSAGVSAKGTINISTSNQLTVNGGIAADSDIVLTANEMEINSTINAFAGGSNVTLQNRTPTTVAIDLGSTVNTTADTLELSFAELDSITAADLIIGNATSGAIVVTDALAFNIAKVADLHLITGSSVSDTGAGGISGNINLAIESGGAVILDGTGNNAATLAIDAGSNNVTFVDSSLLTIGDVAGVQGISGNDVTLTAATGNLIVANSGAANDIDASGSVNLSVLAAEQNLEIATGAVITATAANHIYTADNIQVDGTIDASGRSVTIQPQTSTVAINLGTNAGAANTLEIDAAEISRITADTLLLGNNNAGDISISTAIAPGTVSNLQLATGGAVIDANAVGTDITTTALTVTSVNGIGDTDVLEIAVSAIDLTNSASGNIEIANTGTLAITQAVQSGTGDILIAAGGNANVDINVNGTVSTATGGNVSLTAEDSVMLASAGDITATGAGSVNLTANNDSVTAGDSGDVITMADGAVIDAGTGTVSLSTSGTDGGDITLGQIITANTSNTSVALTSESGILDADASTDNDITSGGRLLITANTGVGDTGAIETAVASIDITNAGSGNISIANTGNLSVQRAVQSTAGNIILSSTGNIIETGSGTISADTLTTSSTGDTTLNSSNNTVASFNATTNTSGNISLVDSADGLVITGINSAGNASITTTGDLTQSGVINAATLTTVSNSGDTTLAAANTLTGYNGSTNTSGNIIVNDSTGGLNITGINAAGNATITVTGNLTQTGVISAGTLVTTSNSGSTTLNAANTISTFNGTSNTSGDVSITDSSGGLIVAGINSAGDASVTTTGNLTQTGIIVASELTTVSNAGDTVLTAANLLDAYNGSTNTSGDITLLDNAGGLDISGIDAAGDVSITTTGSLTQTGVISAGKLVTVSNNGSTNLGAANTIAAYDGTTNTSGDIIIRDTAAGLDIIALASAGDATITTTGNLTQSGIINASTLTTVSNSGNTTLTAANTIATYNGTSNNTGNITITDSAGGLVISGINSAGNATVTTTGSLTQTGAITAGTLTTVSNNGNTVLDAANSISAYSGTTNTSGSLTFINTAADTLDIIGVSAAGNVQLTTDAIAINGNIDAGANRVTIQTLTAGNAIDLGSATDTAADTLEISNAELARITAATLTIGDAGAGNFNITQDVTVNSAALHIITAGNVQSSGGGIIGGNQLAVESGGSIVLTDASTDVSRLAAVATQDITIVNATATTIGTVDGVSGISGNNISITNTNGNLVLDNAITANAGGDVTISLQGAGAALVTDTAGENITSTSGDISISASVLTLANGIISSSGNLILDTAANNTTIGIGDTSTGDFNLDATELSLFLDGFSGITIGNASSGNVDIRNVAFTDQLTVQGADVSVDGLTASGNNVTINSTGFIRGVSNATVDLAANNISLTAASGGIGLTNTRLDVSAASTLNADTSASNSAINISSPVDMNLGIIDAGTATVSLQTAGMINDTGAGPATITAGTLNLAAVTGIANSNELNVSVNTISVTNSGAGDVNINDPDNLTLSSLSNDTGDVTITTGNNINLADGAVITTVNGGGISFFPTGQITSAGVSTISSAGGFIFNKPLELAGSTTITTAEQLNITENITTSSGALTLDSTAISFGSGVVLTAADSITIANAVTTANGDISMLANGIELMSEFTVNNGELLLNAGNDDLSINSALTINNGNITIIASDLDIAPTGLITATDTVSLADAGNGMALGGTVEPGIFNISLGEYELITASAIDLNTQNTLTLKDDFQTNVSLSPLTINANEMIVQQSGTVLGLLGNLDLAETVVTAASDFTINVAGTFAMNNSLTTNGVFTLTSASGITIGDPLNLSTNESSIVSNNNNIHLTSTGGDILLGYLNAGSGNVDVTASAGSILNNNGVFTNVLQSKTNVLAANLNLDANQRIGASSTDAITLNINPNGVIVLDFNAEKAFINNLQNTRIQNNGTGDVAIGLIFSAKIIGIGHNTGLSSQQTEEVPSSENSEQKLMSVMGSDYILAEVEEEEDDVSSLNAVVPVMIRTKDGWEFKAPSRNLNEKKGSEQKIDWM